MLRSATRPGWFAAATADVQALLSDHLHCERKAAENALSLVRRYPHMHGQAVRLSRLAHEETSHVVQVALLIEGRGGRVKSDSANHYARRLGALIRGREPQRLLDELLVAAFIEARSHERLRLLAEGFGARGEADLAAFYAALADAEERHAAIFIELAAPLVSAEELAARRDEMADAEAAIVSDLPLVTRIH